MSGTPVFNPITKTEIIQRNYFDFFLSSFSPTNKELQEKLKRLKKLRYLWREPFIAISKRYKIGQDFASFEKNRINDKIKLGFRNIKFLYKHQEDGIRNILNDRNTVISTGTGSGKTEIFLIPILNYCFENRDKKGVKAILVYPMNALANDQVERLRRALWFINQGLDRKITFAIYTGETPESTKELIDFSGLEENHIIISEDKEKEKNERKKIGCQQPLCDKLVYDIENLRLKCKCGNIVIDYQLLTREKIRENPPDILITNYVQLEHLLLRKKDEKIFSDGQIKFIVFDEIHAYSGARGIDVALLNRRLLSRLRKYGNPQPIYIGTSATISTLKNAKERKKKIAEFARYMFGEVEFSAEDVIEGIPETFKFEEPYKLDIVVKIPHTEEIDTMELLDHKKFFEICKAVCKNINEEEIKNWKKEEWSIKLGELLIRNPFFQLLIKALEEPSDFGEIFSKIKDHPLFQRTMKTIANDKSKMKTIIWSYLKTASLASHPELSSIENKVPLIRVSIHNFFRTIDRIYRCNSCSKLYLQPKNYCSECGNSVDELGVCRFCGKEFLISIVNADDLIKLHRTKGKGQESEEYKIKHFGGKLPIEKIRIRKLEYSEEFETRGTLPLWQSFLEGNGAIPAKKCIKCGSILDKSDDKCIFCDSPNLKEIFIYIRNNLKEKYESEDISERTQPHHCPFCNSSYGRFSALSPLSMSSNTAAVTLFDIIYSALPENFRKLLIFTDNRQAASYLAGYLEEGHIDHALRSLIYYIVKSHDDRITSTKLEEECLDKISNWLNPEVFQEKKFQLLHRLYQELSRVKGRQRSIESLGLIEVTYKGLETLDEFKELVEKDKSWNGYNLETLRLYLISFLNLMRWRGALFGLHKKFGREHVVGFIEADKKNKTVERFGIELIGVCSISPRSSIYQLTKKVFKTNNTEKIKELIIKSFQFLKHNNFITKVDLRGAGRKTVEAFVVRRNKLIIKIPKYIFECEKCKKIYTNTPLQVCLTNNCHGITNKKEYIELLTEMSHYYRRLYISQIPFKMATKEDTGALSLRERRKIETEFKNPEFRGRKVDVIVATPTLELGVDIGDLLSIGLFKAPPSPASYLQRVGRAGRSEKISFNNTFLFLNPIDKFYFKFPQKLIKGEVEAPKIKLDNLHLLQRHINSLVLEELLIHSTNSKMYEKNGIYEMYKFVFNNFLDVLKKEIKNKKEKITERISLTLKDLTLKDSPWITDQMIGEMINKFIRMLAEAIERYKKKLDFYKEKLNELNTLIRNKQLSPNKEKEIRRRRNEVEDNISDLERTSLVSYLMDTNVLPRYAFPGTFVDINDVYGIEEFSGRARNYAITEYAPNMEVYLKKAIYKSIGIDLESIRHVSKRLYVCSNCKKFVTENDSILKRDGCPICKHVPKEEIKSFDAIEPNVIYVKRTGKPLNEPRKYQEPLFNIFFSETPKPKPMKCSIEPNIKITKYENVDLIIEVFGININGEEFQIELCEKCGKVRQPNEPEYEKHYKIGSTKREICNGKYRKISLFHKMPTNVISIKFTGDSIFGIDKKSLISEWKTYKANVSEEQLWHIFLVTFKNAIINAAQRILQTEDGEIDGEVKDDEIILYDNVDGGVGYVDEIAERFDEILREAAEIVLDPDDECDTGCLDCLWSYRRKKDIRFIDKRFVKKVFRAIEKFFVETEILKEGEIKKNFVGYESRGIRTIHSPPYSFFGILELKKLLRSAKEEIVLTSLYVTDSPIPWPDEKEKSWVNILADIKLSSPTLKITVIVREPTSKDHADALKRLSRCGVKVKVYKKEIESMLPSIIHSKLIVIDPHIPSSRYAIHTSANFSPEMWKNHETFDLGNDENWVKGTYREIKEISEQSMDFKVD